MKPLEFLSKACEDGDGNVSTMRVIVLYGCLVNLSIPAAMWIASAWSKDAAALAVHCSEAAAGVMTMLLSLKCIQNSQEKSTPAQPAP